MVDEQQNQYTSNSGRPALLNEHNVLRYSVIFFFVGLLFVLFANVLQEAANVVLLLFACVLVSILFYEASHHIEKWLHLPHWISLTLVIVVIFSLLGIGGWLMAPQVAQQARDLSASLPQAFDQLRGTLAQYSVLRETVSILPSADELISRATSFLSKAGLLFTGLLGALGNALIITVVGIYLAAQPALYINGIVHLVPPRKRERARQVLSQLRESLGLWLGAKLLTMLVVGTLTAIGLSLLGVPLALVLGIIAGLLDFIPYIGPIIAGVPAVLMAFSQGPTLALYVVLLFMAVQLAEGYLLLPLIERRAVSLAPALLIMMQVIMGALFGLAGVALATPLLVVAVVLITMLYVQDVLGDPAKPPGKH